MSDLMKDSGVEWLGIIPASWNLLRMQDIADYKKGPFGSAITVDMFVEKGENTFKVYEQKNAIQGDAKLGWSYINEFDFRELKDFNVNPGDLIVSCAGTIGKCFILPNDIEAGIINQALMRVRINKEHNIDYFIYLFEYALEYMNSKYSNGSAIKNIPPFNVLKKQKVALPSPKEQEYIANFLDKRCKQIDKIIVDLERQIQILKEYFASTLEECILCNEKTKIKYVADFYNGDRSERYPSGDEIIDEGIPFLNSENIHGFILDEPHRFISLEKYNSLSGAKIKKDDIVYCLRGSVGNCSINKSLNEGTVASSLTVIRSKHINPDFLNYVLKSELIKQQLLMYQNGSCAANLSAENVGNFIIAFPTEKEQLEIVNKLNKKYSVVNEYISKKEDQLSYLKQYKSSLIYEYVTGKKRVKVGE